MTSPRLPHHRDGMVSSVVERDDGLFEETWTSGGHVVRRSVRGPDGGLLTDTYFRGGRIHREDGPAEVVYHGGVPIFERWRREDVVHRADGPAEVNHVLATGKTVSSYVVNGSYLASGVQAALALYSFGPHTLFDEFQRSGYAPLLAEGFTPEAILEVRKAGVDSIEGVTAVLRGAPVEWAIAFETGEAS